MERKFRCTNNLAAFLLTKEAKQLVDFAIQEKLDFRYYTDGSRAIEKANGYLTSIGSSFKYVRPGSGTAAVFISKQHKTVVKFCGTHSADVRIPEYAVSTVFVTTTKIRDYAVQARIQHLVDRSDEAIETAYDFLRENHGFEKVGGDFHQGNVGMWKGKPVMIDW